jgi:hypothetical protein
MCKFVSWAPERWAYKRPPCAIENGTYHRAATVDRPDVLRML